MSSRRVDNSVNASSAEHMSTTPPSLLNAEQAAQLLNVPASWVLAEARADRIPHVRLGRYVRFEADELRAWWAERRRGPWRARGRAAGAARTGVQPVSSRREAA
jgi:excisionase family DNA binding protein